MDPMHKTIAEMVRCCCKASRFTRQCSWNASYPKPIFIVGGKCHSRLDFDDNVRQSETAIKHIRLGHFMLDVAPVFTWFRHYDESNYLVIVPW